MDGADDAAPRGPGRVEDPRDRPFFQLGVAIFASYAFYVPVLLFMQQAPLIGMLMIPTMLAYLAMA